MSTDQIVIIRHGKPALSRRVRLDWRGYREWWKQYDAGGLAPDQKIPAKVKKDAAEADIVLSSPLKRAVESAELARGAPPDRTDNRLVEAALPPPHLGPLKFRPKTWGTYSRVFWYFGWSDGMETHSEARQRANEMAEILAQEAAGGKLVFVAAHGWFNRMLKGSLKKQGWKCVKQNGDLHWSRRRFVRPTQE